jgi:hypothetical protein
MNYIRDTLEIDVDHATLYAWRTEVMKLYSHTTLETDVCFHVDDGLLRVPRFRWIRHAVATLSDTLEKENYQVSEGIRSRDIKLHVRFEGCRNAESRKDESKKDGETVMNSANTVCNTISFNRNNITNGVHRLNVLN